MSAKEPLLRVEKLCMYFSSKKHVTRAAQNVSFEINEGETYGLVGESGSGKSTIGRCVIRLYNPTSGKIYLKGRDISGALDKEKKELLYKNIQMIFQDPMSSLNPRKTAEEIVGEGLDIHHLYKSREERREKILRILSMVGLSPEQAGRYPAQFSGGQRQRIGIARALVMEPSLIIADECIAALDVSIQAQVVNMLRRIKNELGTSFLFISHDLSMVRYLSDKIGVLHLGFLLESGTSEEIFSNPVHPYTRSLISAIPSPNPLVKLREREYYDMEKDGVYYDNGSWHLIEGTHKVWCTDAEYQSWTSEKLKEDIL